MKIKKLGSFLLIAAVAGIFSVTQCRKDSVSLLKKETNSEQSKQPETRAEQPKAPSNPTKQALKAQELYAQVDKVTPKIVAEIAPAVLADVKQLHKLSLKKYSELLKASFADLAKVGIQVQNVNLSEEVKQDLEGIFLNSQLQRYTDEELDRIIVAKLEQVKSERSQQALAFYASLVKSILIFQEQKSQFIEENLLFFERFRNVYGQNSIFQARITFWDRLMCRSKIILEDMAKGAAAGGAIGAGIGAMINGKSGAAFGAVVGGATGAVLGGVVGGFSRRGACSKKNLERLRREGRI